MPKSISGYNFELMALTVVESSDRVRFNIVRPERCDEAGADCEWVLARLRVGLLHGDVVGIVYGGEGRKCLRCDEAVVARKLVDPSE